MNSIDTLQAIREVCATATGPTIARITHIVGTFFTWYEKERPDPLTSIRWICSTCSAVNGTDVAECCTCHTAKSNNVPVRANRYKLTKPVEYEVLEIGHSRWNSRNYYGDHAADLAELSYLRAYRAWADQELKSLNGFARNVNQALNEGDGVYRP